MPIRKRKLTLYRETIRVLTSLEMSGIAGGGPVVQGGQPKLTVTCIQCPTIPQTTICTVKTVFTCICPGPTPKTKLA
jgi:hypothetical protein